MKPAIKRTLLPIVRKEGAIEITFNRHATELEDADGAIYRLCEKLTGEFTIEEIGHDLNLSIEEVEGAVEGLNELGFIENHYKPEHYTETELERYRSNLNYFSGFSDLTTSKFDIQDRLRGKKVALLGLGGGSLAAAYLAGLGVSEIVGVDYDVVERSNLNRQFLFDEGDIGKLKTDATREKIEKLNPEVSITTHNLEITSYEQLLPILEGAEVVINMMDQPPILSKRWVNAACVKLKIPYYSGGVNNQFIRLERTIPASNEPCYDCTLLHNFTESDDFVYRIKAYYGKVLSNVNTGFAPNISLLTGMMIADITKLLTGISPISKPLLSFDLGTMSLESLDYEVQPYEKCPTCSGELDRLATLDDLLAIAKKGEVHV